MEVQQADDYFGYTEKGSSFDAEVRAGLTTFLTMAYILLVNPAMLLFSTQMRRVERPFPRNLQVK